MELNAQRCYEALKARDSRFDGRFFVGVSSTRIYCRPVCTARTPGEDRCRFFANPACAERAGYRPCLKCRPELAPGLAPIDSAQRVARFALGRIEAGALNEAGLEELARECDLSERQLRRVIEKEYGITPVELAQTRRLLLAKHLLTDSRMGLAEVAFASGFGSVRRFNHLFRTRYGLNPTAMRRNAVPAGTTDGITLRLGYRPPFAWEKIAGFLASRGGTGVEHYDGEKYWRSVSVGGKRGWVCVCPAPRGNALLVELAPELLPVLPETLARLRRLFDLDASPGDIEKHLSRDAKMRGLIKRTPGLRVPGAFDGFEVVLRAILGQQVTVKAATTLFTRFIRAFGEAIETPCEAVTHAAPRAEAIARAKVEDLIALGLTGKRAETVRRVAVAVAEEGLSLEPSADPERFIEEFQKLPGIGDWTAQYVAMRALGHPDGFPKSDLGLMKALGMKNPKEIHAAAEGWRPWRAYAAIHLWNGLNAGGG